MSDNIKSYEKEERWLYEHAQKLHDAIVEYNGVAEGVPNADVIVAFQMTVEERKEFLNDNAQDKE